MFFFWCLVTVPIHNAKVLPFSHTTKFRLSIRADFQHGLHDFGPYVINEADFRNFRARFITDTVERGGKDGLKV